MSKLVMAIHNIALHYAAHHHLLMPALIKYSTRRSPLVATWGVMLSVLTLTSTGSGHDNGKNAAGELRNTSLVTVPWEG